MRPIYLKMSAFGPYAGTVEIHMDRLGGSGIYLITGDTGAGKTTIFDAICYALYDKTGGQLRDGNMLRSKYAEPGTPTEVELVFEHGGREYTIRRNPEYMRPSKRGEGMTTTPADASLTLPDGQAITKKNQVNAAVEELLGLSFEQFTQVSMIAQGEFRKLLLATTKERQEIFRKLFETGHYLSLQEKLKAEAKRLRTEYDGKTTGIHHAVSRVTCDETDVLSLELAKAKAREMTLPETASLIEQILEGDRKRETEVRKQDTDLEKALEDLNRRIGGLQELEKAKQSLAKEEENLKALEAALEAQKPLLEKAKEDLKAKEGHTEKATALRTLLPRYQEADTLRKNTEDRRKRLEQAKQDLQTNEQNLKRCNDDLKIIAEELDTLKDAGAGKEKAAAELERIDKNLQSLQNLKKEFGLYAAQKEKLEKAQADYLKKDELYRGLRQTYETLDNAFRDGQAGVLAERLQPGVPCPVCGAIEHPAPACKPAEVPSEEELKVAKAEAEEAGKAATAASENAASIKAALEEKKHHIISLGNENYMVLDPDTDEPQVDQTIKRVREDREKAQSELKAQEARISRKAELEKKSKEYDGAVTNLNEAIEKQRTEIASAESTNVAEEKQLADLEKTLTPPTLEEANALIAECDRKAAALQKAFDDADAAFRSREKAVESSRGLIKGYREQLASGSTEDPAAVTKERDEKTQLRAQTQETLRILTTRISTNDTELKEIRRGMSEAEDIEKQLRIADALSRTANADLTGKKKITLEAYIQATYFDRILGKANVRLMTMSGGQYELKRAEDGNNQSQSGLELNVIDHYNGTERSVKSLSGGESFMASLSLALGLSDEVQSGAGGIQVDTMFVDEGFGSLDPDSLDQAYRALTSLSEGNRLVGIISHVADLKNKIDSQIIVKKERTGGSFITLQT
ncbi:MAG: SMC family ATPase [Lachnospiraceae bacterium]|nr:SMC family ATPase [Lachnospiraceae bacterium]